jgi:hypothetical protein
MAETEQDKYSQTLDDEAEYLNILYYGDPGSGKTSAAAAMAHLGIVYLVDVESGAKKRPLRKLGIPTSRIRPVRVGCYKDLDQFYWHSKTTKTARSRAWCSTRSPRSTTS